MRFMETDAGKLKSLLLLAALVPAASLGVLFGMMLFPDTTLGKTLFLATKIWMLAIPAVWWLLRRKRKTPRQEFPPQEKRSGSEGVIVSVCAGIAILAVIVSAYALLGDRFIDKEFFLEKMRMAGLGGKHVFIAAAAYWICVNSLLEEIVWRWFVTERLSDFTCSAAAVVLSGLCFTLHHILAMSVYFPPLINIMASTGVFIGGVLFSWLYVRYKSIWPPYIAHVFADIAVFGIGYTMLG